MENKIIICGCCGESQNLSAKLITDNVYFPNRTVYADDKIISCSNNHSHDMIIFGKNYVSPISVGYDKYLANKTIISSNVEYFNRQIKLNPNSEKHLQKLKDYENCIKHYNRK